MADSDKFEPMDEEELNALLDDKRANAHGFEEKDGDKYSRAMALRYMDGEVDFEAPTGRSSVTDRTVSDTVGLIMPSLAGIFLGSDDVAEYGPTGPEHVKFAKDATRYINHLVMNECDGYNQIYAALYDGEQLGNGLFKAWWDESTTDKVERYAGLTDVQFGGLKGDKDITVLEEEERETEEPILDEATGQPLIDPTTGQPVMAPAVVYDVKVKRVVRHGQFRLKAMPPEEFFIAGDDRALTEEECTYAAHVYESTRSDLVRLGYKKSVVLDIPMDNGTDFRTAEADYARSKSSSLTNDGSNDPAMEPIEIEEAYVRVDFDGDGIAEWRKVVRGSSQYKGGGKSQPDRYLLENEEWNDPLPFSDIKSDPVPHRWRGRSVFDLVKDIQDVQTVVKRGVLDSLYFSLTPRSEVVIEQVRNPDSLIDPVPGENVHVDRAGTITPLVQPFLGEAAFPVIEHFDALTEKRTGVSRATAGTDLDTLQDQTATATNAAMSAMHAKIALKARNIQQGGMKRLFENILKIVVTHQKEAVTFPIGKGDKEEDWLTVEPGQWDPNMRATVNIGLGTGSRERDQQVLALVIQDQDKVIAQYGPDNPVCGLEQAVNSRQKFIEAAGLRNPEQFYKSVTPEDIQEWMQKKQQEAANAPNPEAQKAQAQAAADQQKLQATIDKNRVEAEQKERKMMLDADMRVREAEQKRMLDLNAQAQEHALAIAELNSKHRIRVAEIESDARLRLREQDIEESLAERQIAAKASRPDTNIDRN